MKKFLIKGLIFFIVLAICIFFLNFILLYPENKLLQLPSNVTTIFLGNSTIECAINDSLLNNSVNLARSSESLEFVYAKLKLLKEHNTNLDTVFLGFDDIILYNKNFIPAHTNIYLTKIFNFDDIKFNFKENHFKRNIFFSHLYDFNKIRPMIKYYFDDSANIKNLSLGGYLPLRKNNLDTVQNNEKNRYIKSIYINPLPLSNKYYIEKIINYCKDNDITLIFLSTPKYSNTWTDSLYRQVHKKYYSEIKLIDQMNKLYPDSCYGDAVHLNYKGAIRFTRDFEILEK